MNNYTILHLHSDLSNAFTTMDSVTKYKMYIDRAKELKMKSIAFTEHGNVFEWLHKKEYCESCKYQKENDIKDCDSCDRFGKCNGSNKIKYIHGVEAYVTESLDEKIRDNYHVILLAKNYEAVNEINTLMSHKFACNRDDGHFYYNPRITFDELINTSDNVIITSACLGGIIGKGSEGLKSKFIKFMTDNKHRCFLELQHHLVDSQIELNKELISISKDTGIRLTVGTDTHSLNSDYSDGRVVLQKSKNIHFENEDGWDLTFKTYDELVEIFSKHDYADIDLFKDAINTTNVISDMVEEFELDRKNKYPKLYENSEKVFRDKIEYYIKDRGIVLNKERSDRIEHEFKTYVANGAIDYMLLEEDIKAWCRRNDIEYGYSRGSVSGSYIAYILRITDVDSIKYNLNFERFMSMERLGGLADIDTDYPPSKRHLVREYINSKEELQCAEIVTFNTIATKGAIKDVGRAFDMPLDELNEINKNFENKEQEYRGRYPDLFKYVDLLNGVIVSVGSHPCGFIVSPKSLEDNICTFTTTTSEYPISQLNMKEIDSLNFVKLDLLGLDNIEVINETCKLAGIERLTPDNTDYEDMDVWKSMRNDSFGIFQWNSDFAHSYFRQLFSDGTLEKILEQNPNMKMIDLMTVGNGAIRPAGESYRSNLSMGIFNDNGHPALNELLSSSLNYLCFQEQIIEFLNKFCGYSYGQADIVRRGFSKKLGTEEFIPKIKAGFIKTMMSEYGETRERSEELIVGFIEVIISASRYLFSINHSDPYSRIGYACGWLRYYYPLEFIAVSLNMMSKSMDKTSMVTNYMSEYTDIKLHPIKFRHSKSDYSINKELNSIYKGMGSIKGMNAKGADELYELREGVYDSFTGLLTDIYEHTCLNKSQILSLIRLDFFLEFGNSAKLEYILELHKTFSKKKTAKKDKLPFEEELIRTHSEKETEKQFSKVDYVSILKELEISVECDEIPIKLKMDYQLQYLGYINFIDSTMDKRYALVMKLDTKYSPRFTAYCLNNGSTADLKVKNKPKSKYYAKKDVTYFQDVPFENGDMIYINKFSNEHKRKKTDEGDWIELPETEWWAMNYSRVE